MPVATGPTTPLSEFHKAVDAAPGPHRAGPGSEIAYLAARRLVAAALPARDPAAIIPHNRDSLHAAALSGADGNTAGADANCSVGVIPATVPIAVVAVPADLNIDALGHLDAL